MRADHLLRHLPVLALALSTGTLSAQSVEGWGITRWGMTIGEVQQLLAASVPPPRSYSSNLLHIDPVRIAGTDFVVVLYFSDSASKLNFVSLFPSGGANSTKELFDAVFDYLAAKHGKPAIHNRAVWDTTEARQSTWTLGPTTIDLELLNASSDTDWRFTYRPTVREAAEGDAIRYVEPSALKEIPDRLIEELQRLGCRVPQLSNIGQQNVITGRFLSQEDRSWAVLCSRAGASAILVFSGRDARLRATLAPRSDSIFSGFGGSFLRRISVASPAFITRHDEIYGNSPPLPALDHDGIDDAFVEKGSSTLYFDGQKWRTLAGAD